LPFFNSFRKSRLLKYQSTHFPQSFAKEIFSVCGGVAEHHLLFVLLLILELDLGKIAHQQAFS